MLKCIYGVTELDLGLLIIFLIVSYVLNEKMYRISMFFVVDNKA